MARVRNLLDHQFRAFAGYALLILLVSTPVYYFVVDHIWVGELDEHNQIRKEQITYSLKQQALNDSAMAHYIGIWNLIQTGDYIALCDSCNEEFETVYDSTKTVLQGDSSRRERVRGLVAGVDIKGQIYLLHLQTNVEETDETLLMLFSVTVLFFLILLGGLLLLNKRIAYTAWKPFNQILNELRNFDLTKQRSVELQETQVAEFNELIQTLQTLIKKSISAFANQKTFTENASHELQTPLALLKSKIELISQDPGLTEEQLKLFQDLNLPLARLNRVNKNLLLLAKLDNKQFLLKDKVDFSTLVEEGVEMLSGYAVQKELQLELEIGNKTFGKLNLYLAETIIQNLLSNAIRYAPQSGNVQVYLDEKEWRVINTGNKPLIAEELFQRFSHRKLDDEGNGLGLAIADEICTQFNWQIQYEYIEGMHQFKVLF